MNFFGLKQYHFTIADIQTIFLHYAFYRFRRYSNLKTLVLNPDNGFQIESKEKQDAIFCITVFEHLNNPAETIKRFHQILEIDGILIFDYILGDGDGLDTMQAVRDRNIVLDFINEKFDVVFGKISKTDSMALTVIRKK